MKRLLLIGLFFSISNILLAQSSILQGQQAQNMFEGAVMIKMNDQNILPKFIDFGAGLEISPEDFPAYLKEKLQLPEASDFRLINVEKRLNAEKHFKYIQTFQGKDVEFSRLIIHINSNRLVSANMELINDFSALKHESIDSKMALNAALNYVSAKSYKWEIPEEEEFLKRTEGTSASHYPNAELLILPKNARMHAEDLHLAYRFDVYAHEPLFRADVYVDAISSEVLFVNNKIHHVDTKGTAVTTYSGNRDITTDSVSSSSFRLRSSDRGNGIFTYNMKQGKVYGNAVDFTDSDNYWNNVNTQEDEVATDAHWGAQLTYDYFYNQFNRNSINDQGFALNSFVHYDVSYANAFWDGNRMTYGDGSGWVSPLTALDITAHEITHGLTDNTADLVYRMESGALNESFSDIFAAAIENYGRPNNNNWKIGEDIGITLRNMSNPKQYGDPDTRDGIGWISQNCVPARTNDYCGVHTNSGVQNHWFYLLVSGGSGTNDLGHSYSVNGIGMDKAAAIAYRNLSVYLSPTSDYDDARFYSIVSAIDLFGNCSPELAATVKAWYAVGVGPDYVAGVNSDFSVDFSTSCKLPHTVNFTNLSSNGLNYEWDFGDGSAKDTSLNPSHVYSQVGQYDVRLIVDGDTCGTDTLLKKSYIVVDTNVTCSIVLKDGINPVQKDCEGKFYDTGGPANKYSNNETVSMRISPLNASSVSLIFNKFDVEEGTAGTICDYDYFEVYDGPNTNFPLLGRYCNNNPPPSSVSSTSGDIFILFSSDPGLELNGFEVSWECTYATTAPQAEFANNLDSSCTGEISFYNRSLNGPTQFMWDFGDGNTSTQRSPTHRYQKNGNFSVSLNVSNTFGSDSISKSNLLYISAPFAPSVIQDSVCIGDTAFLTASGSGWMRWYASMDDSLPLADGPGFSTNNIFSDTTFYVENWEEGASSNIGATNTNIGTGGYYTGDQHMIFDVYKTLIIESVEIYSSTSKSRTIQLRNSQGNVLQSKTFTVSTGSHSINLNFEVEKGVDYELGFPAGSLPSLYRNNSGTNYPYKEAGLISLKNSSAGSGYYYFFYNWKVKELDCLSPRIEARVIVDSSCSVTSISDISKKAILNIYPNPSNNELNIQLKDFNAGLKEMALYSLEGKKVKSIASNIDLQNEFHTKLNISDLPAGIYFLKLITTESEMNRKFIIAK